MVLKKVTRSRTTPPPLLPQYQYLSVSFEVSNCQIQRNFGWRYAIGRTLRMFPQLHVCLIKYCLFLAHLVGYFCLNHYITQNRCHDVHYSSKQFCGIEGEEG